MVVLDQENTEDDWKLRLVDLGYGPEDDWSRLRWYSLQDWPSLDTAAGGRVLAEHVTRHGAKLVILDTQSKFLEGEEDKSFTSAAFYRHTLLQLKRMGLSVVILDHAGNDGSKPRGSSGKRDDVDTVWRLTIRTIGSLKAERTHARKRHEQDVLYLRRQSNPLRHEVDSADDDRQEQAIDRCVTAIYALEPRPTARETGNSIIKRIKDAGGKGYQRNTALEAIKRYQRDALDIVDEAD